MLPEPVIDAAGAMPTSPLMVVEPVLVMFGVPARTAKFSADSSMDAADTKGTYISVTNATIV
jgi:hypothetical protein